MTEHVTRQRDISKTETNPEERATESVGNGSSSEGIKSSTVDGTDPGRPERPARERDVESATDSARGDGARSNQFTGQPPLSGSGNGARSAASADGQGDAAHRPDSAGTREGYQQWLAETEAVLAEADSARIDVYLRSMLPSPGAKDAQLDVLDRLASVEESPPVEDVSVSVWGERICLCDRCRDTEAGAWMVDAVRRFRRWGVEYGASTDQFFERTQQRSSVVGTTHEGIAPPRVTAALVVDGSLQGVFPAQFDDECYSVHDFSSALVRLFDDDRRPLPVE